MRGPAGTIWPVTTASGPEPARRFYVETLGCPKNVVDSDTIVGSLLADGLVATDAPSEGSKARAVLMTEDELEELRARV